MGLVAWGQPCPDSITAEPQHSPVFGVPSIYATPFDAERPTGNTCGEGVVRGSAMPRHKVYSTT